MEKETLINLGLTKREVDVYYELLKTEDSLASEISEKTKESRTNTYDTLNSLIKKGLVAYVIKNNKKYFVATDPKKLLDWIEIKKDEVEKEKKLIENLLPELTNMRIPKGKKVIVEVYEGKEGFRTTLKETIESAKKANHEILMLNAQAGVLKQIDPIYQERYYNEKKLLKIKTRYLFTEGSTFPKSPLADYKFLPKEYRGNVAMSIHGESVIFWLMSEPVVAILVKNKELAQSSKSTFEELWKIAKN